MLFVSANLVVHPAAGGVLPLAYSRIGSNSIHDTSVVSVSSESAGQPKEALNNHFTFDIWTPTALPAWAYYDAGTAITADYAAIAAHTFFTNGNTIKIQYSTNGTDWIDLSGSALLSSDGPAMWLFPETTARYWRIYISGGTVPNLGVFYVGQVLAMQRATTYPGNVPTILSRKTEYFNRRSSSGQIIGSSIRRKGVEGTVTWEHLQATWYRENFDPFVRRARSIPFFLVQNPELFPEEVVFAELDDDVAPSDMGILDYMTVSIKVNGIGYD